jgi:hypothetical protein
MLSLRLTYSANSKLITLTKTGYLIFISLIVNVTFNNINLFIHKYKFDFL